MFLLEVIHYLHTYIKKYRNMHLVPMLSPINVNYCCSDFPEVFLVSQYFTTNNLGYGP